MLWSWLLKGGYPMTTALLVWVRVHLVKMVKCHKLVFSMWATTLVFSGVLVVLALGKECQLQQEGVCVCGDPSVHSYCNSSTCAPDDFDSSCRTPSAVSGDNVVLFDSNDYEDILDGPNSVWIMGHTEAGTSQWHQQGESCQNHLLMCTFSAQTNYWIFSQYIKYPVGSLFLGNTDIFINISSMLLAGSVSIHVYDTNNIVSVTERSNISNYRPLVSSDSGQETIIGASVSEITIRHSTSGKLGFYIGIKNNGIACGQITRILLYYTPCKEQQDGLVYYPELVRPPEGSPPNEAKACCAANSHPITLLTFRAYEKRCDRNVVCECDAGYRLGGTGMECEICPIGTYRSLAHPQDQCMDCPPNTVGDTEGASICKCVAGYHRSKPESDCLSCPAGTYRSFSDSHCTPCPLNTAKNIRGASVCECLEGYFRESNEEPSVPCTAPPGPVRNLRASNTRDTSVTVRWERPEVTGRDDFYYSVEYSDPDNTGSFIVSDSRIVNVASTVTYTVSGLQPNIPYTIRVTTHNGVSDQDSGNEALRISYQFVKTNEGVPSVPRDVRAFPGIVVWGPPAERNGDITGYQVLFQGTSSSRTVAKTPSETHHVIVYNDTSGLGGSIRVQVSARTSAGFGRYSSPVSTITDDHQLCGDLPSPTNGLVRITDRTICSTATYSCSPNYHLVGVATRVCQFSGMWSGAQPACEVLCEDLSSPTNGLVSVTARKVGGRAMYSCSQDYILTGVTTRVCQPSGTWSGSQPTCQPRPCSNLPNPVNGQVTVSSSTSVGGVATYRCNTGFNLVGSSTRTCQLGGTWSGSAPTCQPVQCPTLSNPANGRVSVSSRSIGDRATSTCTTGYTLVGSSSRTCQSNGQWSGSAPTCQPGSFPGCFTGLGCSGDRISVNPSLLPTDQVRECCLQTPALSYNLQSQCVDCIAFGFLESSLSGNERGPGYTIEIGYIKRPLKVSLVLRGMIQSTSGTASGEDFSLNSNIYTARPNNPGEILVRFLLDNVAQEEVETAQLQLDILAGIILPPNLIIRDTMTLKIIDSDIVVFQFTENDYLSAEDAGAIDAVIIKNLRIANPVTFQVFPYTVQQVEDLGLDLSELYVPPDDKPFSPNRAQIDRTDRPQDFSPAVLTITFQADEDLPNPVNGKEVPVPIADDDIDEAQEEVFIINMQLESAINPAGLQIDRASSLCRMNDNDVIQIGFQNDSYTFPEPELRQLHVIFLEKQDGVRTEQTYHVVIQASQGSPPGVGNALPFDGTNNNDFTIQPGSTADTSRLIFDPDAQTLGFDFFLFGDQIPEDLEAFQLLSAPDEDPLIPAFSAPSPGVLFRTTFINIADDDDVTVGFEQNFTVSENIGSFEVCFRVLFPPDDVPLTLNIDLVVDSVEGSAVESDYVPIRSSAFDVFETLSADRRRACFSVMINADNVLEATEEFSLVLNFDQFVDPAVRDVVIIEPSVAYVQIVDAPS